MRLRRARVDIAFGLIGAVITLALFVAGVIAIIYVARLIIRRARSIQDRREQQMTNAISSEFELPPQEAWLISPPAGSAFTAAADGEVRVSVPDEVASNLFSSVANYRIERADSLDGEWTATSNTLAGDLQSLREIMGLMAAGDARTRSNSTMGFYRAVKVP